MSYVLLASQPSKFEFYKLAFIQRAPGPYKVLDERAAE